MSDKIKSAEVRDILGDQLPVALQGRNFIRFEYTPSHWIDVELRDGELLVRGSNVIAIEPLAGNQIAVKLR